MTFATPIFWSTREVEACQVKLFKRTVREIAELTELVNLIITHDLSQFTFTTFTFFTPMSNSVHILPSFCCFFFHSTFFLHLLLPIC